MASSACRKQVYQTMCERADGTRRGRSGKVTYESRYKRGQAPARAKTAARRA